MPLPFAHSLMGYALAETTRKPLFGKFWLNALIFVVLANLPDADFLPGYLLGSPNSYHHQHMHSLGFAAIVGSIAGAIGWRWRRRFALYFTLAFIAVSSHLALDLLTEDFSPPYGMILLWPFSSEHVDSTWKIFSAVHKSDHSHDFFASLFQLANLRTALIEIVVMLPVVGIALLIKRLRLNSEDREIGLSRTQVARLGLLKPDSEARYIHSAKTGSKGKTRRGHNSGEHLVVANSHDFKHSAFRNGRN